MIPSSWPTFERLATAEQKLDGPGDPTVLGDDDQGAGSAFPVRLEVAAEDRGHPFHRVGGLGAKRPERLAVGPALHLEAVKEPGREEGQQRPGDAEAGRYLNTPPREPSRRDVGRGLGDREQAADQTGQRQDHRHAQEQAVAGHRGVEPVRPDDQVIRRGAGDPAEHQCQAVPGPIAPQPPAPDDDQGGDRAQNPHARAGLVSVTDGGPWQNPSTCRM